MERSLQNSEDVRNLLAPIVVAPTPMPVIAPLPPTQDTAPDQVAAFYKPHPIPFFRHSPLPAAGQSQMVASGKSVSQTQSGRSIFGVTRNLNQIPLSTTNQGAIPPIQTQINNLQAVSFQGVWSSGISYSQGAAVSYLGAVYVSLINNNIGNTPASSPAAWQAAGQETFLGAWNSGTAYTIGQVVSQSGFLYIALANNTNQNPSTTSGFWQLLNPAAIAAWNSGTTYLVNNLATFNGNVYISLDTNTNHQPDTHPSDWSVFSVNPATGAVASKGSIPLTQNTGLSYTSTTSSINLIWSSLALYRSDGTVVSIGTSSQNVTTLASGRTYYAFPYYDESSAAFNFISNSQVTFPNVKGITFASASSQEVTTTTSAALTTATSVECWMKVASGYAGGGGLTKATNQTGTILSVNTVFSMGWDGAGHIQAVYRDSGGTLHSLASPQTYNDGEWHHALYVTDPTNSSQVLYIDGVSVATGSVATAVSATAGYYRLAKDSANVFLTGTMTEVAVYNTALTATQAMAHYNAMNSVSQSSYETVVNADAPTIWWKMTDAGPTTVADSGSIGGNTGTAVNSPTFGATSAVFGAIGSPAILWPSRSLLVTQAQALYSRVPFTQGGWAVATTSGGTGGGSNGGSSGGSGTGCFSGNTRIKTASGAIPISQVRVGDSILDKNGISRRILLVHKHEPESRVMHDMGGREFVTPKHVMWSSQENRWVPAGLMFFKHQLEEYNEPVYNLTIDGDAFDQHSFSLANGYIAHNGKII